MVRVPTAAGLVTLYSVTLFVSAILLFSVQPLFAKMVLPLLGGAPAVWNTCLVFFQIVLLGGYAYSHLLSSRLRLPAQMLLHFVLILGGCFVLPLALRSSGAPPVSDNPIPWLLTTLTLSLGLPFFIVSGTAPLLQRWFSLTHHRLAGDPYFLYAASNAGSLVALVAYPAVIEPLLRVSMQRTLWTAGYALLLLLMLACALAARRYERTAPASSPDPDGNGETRPPLELRDRLRWIGLAAAPSSLMIGVTTHLTSDISPIPLLWVLPLALYVTSFVLVFARRPPLPHWLMVRALPIIVLPLVAVMLMGSTRPLWLIVGLHLLGFFVIAMVCHGALAGSRPATRHLTEFYLWISVGGAVGGLLTAIVAPLVFPTLLEYRLALVLSCLLTPRIAKGPAPTRWVDIALPVALGVLVVLLDRVTPSRDSLAAMLVIVGLPAIACFAFRRSPLRFALGLAVLFFVTPRALDIEGKTGIYHDRSFFGVYRVADVQDKRLRALYHGTTIHGAQNKEGPDRLEPLLYFHRAGPAGAIFGAMDGARPAAGVAIIGLGTGSLACYAKPGQPVTFYEIDPTVLKIARDAHLFTFLRDCSPSTTVVLGDGRLAIAAAVDKSYHLVIVDAFSSDAIPMHLLTREAIALYMAKLTDDGILGLHISNRYLDLGPVVAALARDLGLIAYGRDDLDIGAADEARGRVSSQWAVVARRPSALSQLVSDRRWRRLVVDTSVRAWTDDFSNIVTRLRWR
jgi:hypothetical protein